MPSYLPPPTLTVASGDGAPAPHAHRLPPVVHVLVPAAPVVLRHLANAAFQRHRCGGDADEVAAAVYAMGLRLGFSAAVRTQEVVAADLPSFPGRPVATTFVLVDLVPL